MTKAKPKSRSSKAPTTTRAKKKFQLGVTHIRGIAATASLIVTVLVFIAAVPALMQAGEEAGLGWAAWTAPFIVDAALVMLVLGGMAARANGSNGTPQFVVAGITIVLSAWLQLSHVPPEAGFEHYALALGIPITLAAAALTFDMIVFAPIIETARAKVRAQEEARLRAAEKAEAEKSIREAAELRRSETDEAFEKELEQIEHDLMARALKSGKPERIEAAQESIRAARAARADVRDAEVAEAEREIERRQHLAAAADGKRKPAPRRRSAAKRPAAAPAEDATAAEAAEAEAPQAQVAAETDEMDRRLELAS